MAKVETSEIIDKIEENEDITISEEDKKNAELLSLEKIEKEININRNLIKKNNMFIIFIILIIAVFIYLLPILFK